MGQIDLTLVRVTRTQAGYRLRGVEGYLEARAVKPQGRGFDAAGYERHILVRGDPLSVELDVHVEVSTGRACLSMRIRKPDGTMVWTHGRAAPNRFLNQGVSGRMNERVLLAGDMIVAVLAAGRRRFRLPRSK